MDIIRALLYNEYMIINSTDNSRVKLWDKLKQKKYRDQYGLFIVEEKHMIQEAIDASVLDTLIIREGWSNPFPVEAVEVSEKVMKKLSSHVSANDCIAVCRIEPVEIKKHDSFIVMENVQDPGNVGTIIRTAYSLGYDAVYLNESCSNPYGEKTLQASQGAIFHLPVIIQPVEVTLQQLKQQGIHCYATSLRSAQYLSEITPAERFAIVLGNEGKGLKDSTVDLCDSSVKIEMEQFESLNVAIAMAIAAYHLKHHS